MSLLVGKGNLAKSEFNNHRRIRVEHQSADPDIGFTTSLEHQQMSMAVMYGNEAQSQAHVTAKFLTIPSIPTTENRLIDDLVWAAIFTGIQIFPTEGKFDDQHGLFLPLRITTK